MKKIILVFSVVCSSILVSCSKSSGDDDNEYCQTQSVADVTFKNNTTGLLRVTVTRAPGDFLLIKDVAAGSSHKQDISAGTFTITWYSNCATACAKTAEFSRTYVKCNSYTEMQ